MTKRKATNPHPKKDRAGDLSDQLQREAQAAKLKAELVKTLFNRAGLDRLRAVTDEEWRAAEMRDDETR